MRYSVDPQQNLLFDPAQGVFSPMALRYMNTDWPGLFRSQLLQGAFTIRRSYAVFFSTGVKASLERSCVLPAL